MEIFTSSSIHVEYQTNVNIMQMRWRKALMPKELTEGYQVALEFARLNQIDRWLLDLSQMAMGKEETWLNPAFFINLMLLGRHHYIGLVLSENHYKELLQAGGKEGLRSYNSFLKISTFCSAGKALDWLQGQLEQMRHAS